MKIILIEEDGCQHEAESPFWQDAVASVLIETGYIDSDQQVIAVTRNQARAAGHYDE